MSKAWAGGSTRFHRKKRAATLLANAHTNGGRCELALPGTWTTRDGQVRQCLGYATQAHHPEGKALGDDQKYMAVCGPCNRRVGQPKASSGQHKRVSNW